MALVGPAPDGVPSRGSIIAFAAIRTPTGLDRGTIKTTASNRLLIEYIIIITVVVVSFLDLNALYKEQELIV